MSNSPQHLRVAVVAHHPETLDGLLAYLNQVGLIPKGSRTLDPLDLAPSTSALVLFPDDFGAEPACAAITRLRRAMPRLVVVLVTREPQRFKGLDAGSKPLVLLPKPSFGWAILDAIRSRTEVLS